MDARKQKAVDVLEENNRQRWLVRNGHRAYGTSGPGRRAATGVHRSKQPSDLPLREGERRKNGGTRSSSLGADLLCLALLGLTLGFALIGAIWTAIELLRWVGEIFGGGKI